MVGRKIISFVYDYFCRPFLHTRPEDFITSFVFIIGGMNILLFTQALFSITWLLVQITVQWFLSTVYLFTGGILFWYMYFLFFGSINVDYKPRTKHRAKNKRKKKKTKYRRTNRRTKDPCPISGYHSNLHEQIFTGLSAHFDESQPATFDTDSFDIAVDNCCSRCITNDQKDFIGSPRKVQHNILGIGGSAKGTLQGTVRWIIEDDDGRKHPFQIDNVLYQPNTPYRLLSPQHWAQSIGEVNGGAGCFTTGTQVRLFWGNRTYQKTIPLDTTTNVGVMQSAPSFVSLHSFMYQAPNKDIDIKNHAVGLTTITIDDLDAEPAPAITPDDKGLFKDIMDDTHNAPKVTPSDFMSSHTREMLHWHQRLAHAPFEALLRMAKQGILPSRLAKCPVPTCAACMIGKATKRPWRNKIRPRSVAETIKAEKPGDCVCIDQMIAGTPGLIGQMSGFITRQRYKCLTVFVDAVSGYSYTVPTQSSSASEMLSAKQRFEQHCSTFGVKVRHYHVDNATMFTSKQFIQAVSEAGQTLSYAGVEAHFQNGLAERRIRMIQDLARTVLLHAKARWPAAVSVHLWPFAVQHANGVINKLTRRGTDVSREEAFLGRSQGTVRPNLSHQHTFACPVYSLLNKRGSKWDGRATVGLYLGQSPHHARSVAMVLNLTTGYVSPKFHVKWDDHFFTVRDTLNKEHSRWQRATGFSTQPGPTIRTRRSPDTDELDPIILLRSPPVESPTPHFQSEHLSNESEGEEEANRRASVEPDNVTAEPEPRRSARTPKPTERYSQYRQDVLGLTAQIDHIDTIHPLSFAATSDPDTMYMHQALRQPDRAQFIKAMQKELADHVSRGHWKIIRQTQVPTGKSIIPAVWSMKRKRRVDSGEIYKWKARLNLHGGKQRHKIDYWETFSPVVQWFAIRFVLILSLLHKWHTRQVDFVLAYPQADIETDMYMQIPPGVTLGRQFDKKKTLLSATYQKPVRTKTSSQGLEPTPARWFDQAGLETE